jgi:hypothetical protein
MPKRTTFPYHRGLGRTYGLWYHDPLIEHPSDDLFRWDLKYNARQSVCTEWLAFADHIVRYPNKITEMEYGSHEYHDWEIYAVVAGKHRGGPRMLLYRKNGPFLVEKWLTKTLYLDNIFSDNISSIKDQGLLKHMRSFKINDNRHYCENVAEVLGKEYRISQQKEKEMGITVDTNEWKDPDSSVITITSGRSSITLTLKEAMEVLSEIPISIEKYRSARRDSIAEQIKELQSQLSLMDKAVPQQTSAPAIPQPL